MRLRGALDLDRRRLGPARITHFGRIGERRRRGPGHRDRLSVDPDGVAAIAALDETGDRGRALPGDARFDGFSAAQPIEALALLRRVEESAKFRLRARTEGGEEES